MSPFPQIRLKNLSPLLALSGLMALSFGLPRIASAQSVSASVSDPSPAAEQATFTLHEDFEANLFADESMGIANPIAIQWDEHGRLWTLCTLAYAQLEPGQVPDDKLYILSDEDGDGKADRSAVFASGLNMPTGFALGDGVAWGAKGTVVYLAEGPDLVLLLDNDGDGQSDERRVLLTGFGTGDTHQDISNFTFGPSGRLYFSQGLHTLSRVETPWGIVRGDTAGFWRFDPWRLKLEPFCFPSLASQNPCGIAFDRWGALFVKSNNLEVGYVTPGLVPPDHPNNLMALANIGVTPGKSMAGEVVESAHLPDWLQQHILIAGYYSHRVTAFPLLEDGAGFQKVEPVQILAATHESFRPVDIRTGPDGAIYVADWFNPIIGHYQASLRHPDRDKEHGRIWRITAKGRALNPAPDLSGGNLIELLASPDGWTRSQAKRLLAHRMRNGEALVESVRKWIAALDENEEANALPLFEAVSLLGLKIDTKSLNKLIGCPQPLARAYAGRIIGMNPDAIDRPLDKLAYLVRDEHPRVRLEAVIACSYFQDPEALKIALRALDSPMDKYIDYSLSQAVYALADIWVPAMQSGTLELTIPSHLAYTLETYGGAAAAEMARKTLKKPDLPEETRDSLGVVLAKVGDADDLRGLLVDSSHQNTTILRALSETWQTRKLKPKGPLPPELTKLLDGDNTEVRAAAIELAGLWDLKPLQDRIQKLALEGAPTPAERTAALLSFARLAGKDAIPPLQTVGREAADPAIQSAAVEAVALIDLPAAASLAAEGLAKVESPEAASQLLLPFLSRKDGYSALVPALKKADLSAEAAQHIHAAITSAGRANVSLTEVLNVAMGLQNSVQEYSAEFVATLAEEVRQSGDAAAGKEIFNLPQVTCVACHQVGGVGGILGPPLDAVGAGLPLDLIIESVLWPQRQLKEGYFTVSITTEDGRVFSGYEDHVADGALFLRDSATMQVKPIPKAEIADRQEVGSLMPSGLTASLSREQLRDLIRYLWERKGN